MLYSQKHNLYDVLGVPVDATKEEICKKFRNLCLIHHPDKSKVDSKEEFLKIKRAYDILKDDDNRKIYDEEGFDGLNLRKTCDDIFQNI